MSGTWTYWKVYAPTAEMDRVVLELADLVERIAGAATSWHVLRYADHSGPHLRFRAFTSPSSADAVHASRHEVGHPVRLDLYEPEVDKWGTNGVRRAEELFTTSTLLAVHAIRERMDVADLLVRHTVSVLVPDQRTRLAVLRTHAAWWLGEQSSDGGAVESSLAALRDEPPPNVQDGDPCSHRLLGRFVDGLADAMRHAGPGHPPVYHLHQHVHLTMNRLGLSPQREATAALNELIRLERAGVEQA